MKHFFLIFATSFCWTLSGQSEHEKTVFYAADTPEKDSFYVLQTTYTPANGRVDTFKDYHFFRDTFTLKNYRDNVKQNVNGLLQRILFLRLEYDSLVARSLELDTLVEEIIIFVRSGVEQQVFQWSEQPPAEAQQTFSFLAVSRHKKRRRKKYP